MFVRRKPNRSGSVSVQVIDKSNGYRVVRTIGSTRDPEELERLVELGRLFIARHSGQYSLFPADQRDNAAVLDFARGLRNASIRTVGPELIFGRLFDDIGFGVIPEPLLRDIVIARLVYPTSKLKTVDYLYRYRGKTVSVQSIYRFLDRLNEAGPAGGLSALPLDPPPNPGGLLRHDHSLLRGRRGGRPAQDRLLQGRQVPEPAGPSGPLGGRTWLPHRRSIEARVLVAFIAYTIHKELERRLNLAQIPISPQRAAELTQTMYEMMFRLPDDPQPHRMLLQMDDDQQRFYDLLR